MRLVIPPAGCCLYTNRRLRSRSSQDARTRRSHRLSALRIDSASDNVDICVPPPLNVFVPMVEANPRAHVGSGVGDGTQCTLSGSGGVSMLDPCDSFATPWTNDSGRESSRPDVPNGPLSTSHSLSKGVEPTVYASQSRLRENGTLAGRVLAEERMLEWKLAMR